jgi:ComF family protein
MRPSILASLPSQCELCRRWGAALLCDACTARFAAARPRCARCGLHVGSTLPMCGRCQREAPPYAATVCAVDYGFPWDALIHAFKFSGRTELAVPLADRLQRAVRCTALGAWPDLVVPVPLARERLAERGYNQAWELARRVGAALGIEALPDAIERTLDTAHQAGLTRVERSRNLRAAFAPAPRRRRQLAGRSVALVDDVMTTGATAREAAAALLRGGAASVQLWVLARTPA